MLRCKMLVPLVLAGCAATGETAAPDLATNRAPADLGASNDLSERFDLAQMQASDLALAPENDLRLPSPSDSATLIDLRTSTFVPDCAEGLMTLIAPSQYTRKNVTLQVGLTQHYCFDLPLATQPFVTFSSVNLGDSSCSSVDYALRAPDGSVQQGNGGSQPGAVAAYRPGRWELDVTLVSGCDFYTFNVTW